MSTRLNRVIRQCIRAFHLVCLTTLLSICFSSHALGADAKGIVELEERKAFVEKATEETWEQVRQEVAEMAKHGVHPMMMVTTLKPFGDWDFYYVDGGNIVWRPNPGQKYTEVKVPAGFVTDLTSIPRVFWQAIRPEGRYAYAAVVHDYLYWEQNRPREEADEILKYAMEDSKVDPKLAETIYLAVRNFGQAAWNNNSRLKKSGEHRFLKKTPEDFTTSWSEWKKKPGVFADN
jgi:hypothetical protein